LFNPIRDIKLLATIIGIIYVSHSIGIAYEWTKIEPIYNKIEHNETESVDFYAENTMSPFKIFLFKYFV